MRSTALAAALIVGAGAVKAAPALAKPRPVDCPAMPTPNDTDAESSGAFGLTIGGFGANIDRSRSRNTKDVMMREGGFEAWSAAALLSHSCQINRQLYPDDLARQRDELAALRDRLVRHQPAAPTTQSLYLPQSVKKANQAYLPAPLYTPPHSLASPPVYLKRIAGFGITDVWEELSPARFVPQPALAVGIRSGSASTDCAISREAGLHDCRIISENPPGYGFGQAALRYAASLRLRNSVRSSTWKPGRVKLRINISR